MPTVKKVLVVDDDQSLINLLKDYLPKVMKHELYIALTGEEALKIVEEKKPDVLLLDMQLPGIKGTQVLRIIREKYPDTKVLVITSYDKQVKEIVAKLGIDGFFPKPLILNDVIARVEEVLKAKKDTTVVPVTLDEVEPREDVTPKAKILFVEREFWMPYLLPIADTDQPDDFPVKPYGEYEFRAVYCQKDALEILTNFRPDIVICATDIPKGQRYGSESVSVSDLIWRIGKSRYAPRAIIVHGTQRNIDSFGIKSALDGDSIWQERGDMYDYNEKEDKENAERLNKMLWRACFEHNLVRKTK